MNLRQTFEASAARALFVQAWGNYEEERGRSHGGVDLMDAAPTTPGAAKKAAKALVERVEALNGDTIANIYHALASAPGRHDKDPTVEDFGHYAAMQALGHGVSWFDDHPYPAKRLELPHGEFYMQGRGDFHWEWSGHKRPVHAQRTGSVKVTKRKGPPGPASGFGKEKTPADYRARIKWEKWAAA